MAKRYYRKLKSFPEGIDRLESEAHHPISEEQLTNWLRICYREGNMKSVVGYIILKHELWEECMNIGLYGNPQMAFRATWALEWAYEQSDERPEWFFDRMIDDFLKSDNGSLYRVYTKMLCDQMRFGGFRPTDTQAENLTEKCFDLLINPTTRGAVQFWCMDTLLELAPRIEWIAESLENIIQKMSEQPDSLPGMRVALREIGRQLAIKKAAK